MVLYGFTSMFKMASTSEFPEKHCRRHPKGVQCLPRAGKFCQDLRSLSVIPPHTFHRRGAENFRYFFEGAINALLHRQCQAQLEGSAQLYKACVFIAFKGLSKLSTAFRLLRTPLPWASQCSQPSLKCEDALNNTGWCRAGHGSCGQRPLWLCFRNRIGHGCVIRIGR